MIIASENVLLGALLIAIQLLLLSLILFFLSSVSFTQTIEFIVASRECNNQGLG